MDNHMFNSSFNTFGQNSYNTYGSYGTDTNVMLVTSLEEAIMKTTRPNSERVYFHQTLPVFYRIKVDFDGRGLLTPTLIFFQKVLALFDKIC